MNGLLVYKPNAEAVLDRLRRLYQRQALGEVFATMEVPSRALAAFRRQYRPGYCTPPQPAIRVRFWDELLSEQVGLDDDSIPSAYLSELDQGLYGGLLGGEVQFMAHPENGWISSMVAPLLEDLAELNRLKFDRAHPWFQRYLNQLEVFREAATGKFGISHFILIDGLNFVFELVGATKTYLSLQERPEVVRRAIDLAFDLNVHIQETFFTQVPLIAGGTCSNMVQWIPGRVVSESVDPFHMTSVDYFEQWGREPVQRIFDQFDGGVLHLHGNGRHLLEAVCSLRGLRAIFLGDDRGFPPAFEVLDELKARAAYVPLVVQVAFEPFFRRLRRHDLPGGVLYKVGQVPSVEAANRAMEQVRQYRA